MADNFSTSPAQSDLMSSVPQAVRDFRRKGQYVTGHNYICGLSESTRKLTAVAVEVAQLYLVQGHYIRAWEAVTLVDVAVFDEDDERQESFTAGICQVDSACIALLSAFISISRFGKLRTALRIADLIGRVWLEPGGRVASQPT
jgi:hypothetical protein